jgi:hypothetical protein
MVTAITPPTVWTALLPSGRRDKIPARRCEITVWVAPVSSIKFPVIVWLSVTVTIAEGPAASTGTSIVPRGATADDRFGMAAGTLVYSAGCDLKKLSILLAWSLSLRLIHPVTAVLLLIKNHLAPPGACVSAMGVALSPGASVPTGRDASSGAE